MPYWSVYVRVISFPCQSRRETPMNGTAYFSPKVGAFGSNSFVVSSSTMP